MITQYSAWSKDADNILHSSSGGVFFELAKKMVSNGGSVVGVVWDGLKVKYKLSNDLEEIKQMRGSKYVPSNPANVIKQIRALKEKILFVGLPCHIEAVKRTRNTEKMILCDLHCHGLPRDNSYFEEHMKKISKGRNIESISFRDKRKGWPKSKRIKILFSNGKVYDKDSSEDEYYKLYLSKSIMRNTCKSCRIKQKGIGDITIGDFWKVPPKFKNEEGTSFVQINTKKGKEFFNSINSINKKRVRLYHYLNKVSLNRISYLSLKKLGLR